VGILSPNGAFSPYTHGSRKGLVDALVYVTSMSKEPKFHNVKRDIEIFEKILDVPILLIGLEPWN